MENINVIKDRLKKGCVCEPVAAEMCWLQDQGWEPLF